MRDWARSQFGYNEMVGPKCHVFLQSLSLNNQTETEHQLCCVGQNRQETPVETQLHRLFLCSGAETRIVPWPTSTFFVEFHMRLVASFVKDAVVRKDDAKSYVEKSRRVVDTEILSLII